MGCDIHSLGEIKTSKGWLPLGTDGRHSSWGTFFEKKSEYLSPFNWRSYAMFGFLANVRNYSHCIPLSQPKGLPDDSEYLNSPSPYSYDINPMNGEQISGKDITTIKDDLLNDIYHSHSFFTLSELLSFDYEQTFWDRRITNKIAPNRWDSMALAQEGEGQIITYREHLGESFFEDIELLKTFGQPEYVRVIFWFDN